VARAARAGEIVTVANVREAADWLPNPLLPDTYAEMAVPVILGAEGHVVGILDVQENRVGGLDDSDATLLRSLASQIAVAIRNARLFTEVEAALTEAQAAQERYLERSWDREAILQQSRGQSRYSSDRSALPDQAVITAVRRATWSFKQPTLLPLTETDLETEVMANVEARQVLAAPIKLGNTTIGNLQFYAPDRTWSHSELALIEAATDQIAQVAESLRLLKITQERASRERLISEATGRISGVLDFDSLLRVGVAELSQALGGSIETAIRFGSEAELKSAYALVKGSENGTDHSTEYEPLNGSNGHAHED
jgi:GAF domain-containing protein